VLGELTFGGENGGQLKNSTWVGNHTSRPFQQEHLEKILTPGMPSKVDPNKCYTKRNQARRIGKILPV